jgi:hypothetical protein
MSGRGISSLRTLWVAAVLALSACATPTRKAPEPPLQPPPLDASYDWHVLLIAPFGSVLKDIPGTLHEVLLFRDDERSASSADELECYAVDGKLPRFVSRATVEYLLCLKHDRLSRIEATVWAPAEEAVKIFADACSLWAKHGQPAAEGCAGTDRGVAYSGHLDSEAKGAETALTVQLDSVDDFAKPAADHQ